MTIVKGQEFIRMIRKLGRKRWVKVVVRDWRGKGSHVKLHFGDKATFVKHGEIPKGLYHGMLRQLGLREKEFD